MSILKTVKWLLICALAWTFAVPSHGAAVLVGTGTLGNSNDLTVIETSSGQRQEFLDLTATLGNSVTQALAAWSSEGFRWATVAEVSGLFDAFGIVYAAPPNNSFVELTPSETSASSFIDYMGNTAGPFGLTAAVGFFSDGTVEGLRSCISLSLCSPRNFVQDWSAFGNATSLGSRSTGVFLVRDVRAVPEPGTLALLGLALCCILWTLSRRNATLYGRPPATRLLHISGRDSV